MTQLIHWQQLSYLALDVCILSWHLPEVGWHKTSSLRTDSVTMCTSNQAQHSDLFQSLNPEKKIKLILLKYS